MMLKQILLASSMMIAAPVAAQTSGQPAQTHSGHAGSTAGTATTQGTQQAPTTSTAPTGDAITAQTSPATPAPTAPAEPVVQQGTVEPADSAASAQQTAPAQPAPGRPAAGQAAPSQPAQSAATQPAAGGSQVAQIVDREFVAYDKDGDGKLSQAEFDTWMVALRTASDPATKADSPATKQWLGAAFAQADADKNRGVTKEELTGFLSQGQS